MLKDFLQQVQQESTFELNIFNGQLQVRGRILSPSEIEKASLINSLLLQSLADSGEITQFQKMSEKLQDNPDDEIISQAYSLLSKIRPDQIDKVNQSQDHLIAQTITHARRNEDEQWEKIQLVLTQQEQSAERNLLWIGMISKADRNTIINKALSGHKEAVERLATFH